jgi:hypothetical protein
MIKVQLECHNVSQASFGVATMSDKVRGTRKEDIIFYYIQKLRLLTMSNLLRCCTDANVALILQVREACVQILLAL